MSFDFFGFNMKLWKLHSTGDYLTFLVYIFTAIAILYALYYRLKQKRNDVTAAARTTKKLKKLCKKNGHKYIPGLPSQCRELYGDGLLYSSNTVYVVKSFGWGFHIKGEVNGSKWVVSDNNEEKIISNPLFKLSPTIEAVSSMLKEQGITASVLPLAVYADPFQPHAGISPTLERYVTGYGELKKWYHTYCA